MFCLTEFIVCIDRMLSIVGHVLAKKILSEN